MELAERGISAVFVPDNDPDHQGTVYDKEEEESGKGKSCLTFPRHERAIALGSDQEETASPSKAEPFQGVAQLTTPRKSERH